jgi:3,4-dihydroxy 2-butanone 4-phosphate synthase/GTP cyclohydrolase II
VPLQSAPNSENIRYLRTKQQRMGHLLEGLPGDPGPSGPLSGGYGPSGPLSGETTE